MRIKVFSLVLSSLLVSTFSFNSSASNSFPTRDTSSSVIIMGYKEGSKPPYIGSKDDNSGAYQALFSAAAEMIGHELKIVRLPKKRIYHHLKKGDIDFYPSAGYSDKRAQYLYWMANGFLSKQALLSNTIGEEIKDFSLAKGTLLAPLGGSAKHYADNAKDISIQKMGKLPIDKAVLALQLGRGNFYIYDLDTLDYYLKRHKLKTYNEIGMQLHHNAIEKEYTSLKAAFSTNSMHFTKIDNPNFTNKEPQGFFNQKFSPAKESVAFAFQQALKQLQESGYTKSVYQEYFKQ